MFRSIRYGMRGWMGLCAAMAAAVVISTGCSKGNDKTGGDGHDDHHHPHGEHPTVGPHGGPLIEWGTEHEHHLEITFDRTKQQATVYMLDHDAKKPQPVAVLTPTLKLDGADKLIPLTPLPLEGESTEKPSRYVATDPALAAAEEFVGVVSGKVGETPYFGQFKESDAKKSDTHDDHDEGHKDDHDEGRGHEGDDKDHTNHKEGHGEPHGDDDADHKDDPATGDAGHDHADHEDHDTSEHPDGHAEAKSESQEGDAAP